MPANEIPVAAAIAAVSAIAFFSAAQCATTFEFPSALLLARLRTSTVAASPRRDDLDDRTFAFAGLVSPQGNTFFAPATMQERHPSANQPLATIGPDIASSGPMASRHREDLPHVYRSDTHA